MTNHWQLGTYNDISSAHIDTDSEMLFNLIDKNVSNLKMIKGTASIVYINTTVPDTIFCFRKNEDRPLWRGKTDEGMYFSSMKESLECIGCTNIEELKVKTLYSITNGKIMTTSKYLDEDIPTKVRRTTQSSYMLNSGFQEGYMDGLDYGDDDYGQSITRRENRGIELGSKTPIVPIVSRHKIIAYKNNWLRVKLKDDSCKDNHGRILIGDYVQAGEDIQDDSIYARIIVHTDENGVEFKNHETKTILYNVRCLEPLMVNTVNVFAIAMHDGTKSTMLNDVVFVKQIAYPKSEHHDESAALVYNAIYPEESIKRHEGKDFRWEREHFRLMEKHELYSIWKKEKEKTPEEIKKYLEDSYSDVLQANIKDMAITSIGQTEDVVSINNVLKQIEKINKKQAQSLINQIHEQLVDNKDLITAYKNVMANNNFLNNAEEDDVDVDNDTPPNDKAIIPFCNAVTKDISVFGENVDEKILHTVWSEVGDSVDFITNLKNGIDNLRDHMTALYDAGVSFMETIETSSGEALNFEDSEMFDHISTANEQIEELDNNVDSIIEGIMQNYDNYDPNYKKQ